MNKVGSRVRMLRNRLGLSQAEFGARIGYKHQTVAQYETTLPPSEDFLRKIQEAFPDAEELNSETTQQPRAVTDETPSYDVPHAPQERALEWLVRRWSEEEFDAIVEEALREKRRDVAHMLLRVSERLSSKKAISVLKTASKDRDQRS